jgi:hypothetical protein
VPTRLTVKTLQEAQVICGRGWCATLNREMLPWRSLWYDSQPWGRMAVWAKFCSWTGCSLAAVLFEHICSQTAHRSRWIKERLDQCYHSGWQMHSDRVGWWSWRSQQQKHDTQAFSLHSIMMMYSFLSKVHSCRYRPYTLLQATDNIIEPIMQNHQVSPKQLSDRVYCYTLCWDE